MRGLNRGIAVRREESPKIAMIGCGAIAESFYMPAISKYPSVLEKLILVDSNKARAQELASESKVRDYLCDYHEVLNEVDGVIVAVPHHLHYPISMDFLTKGVHVLCEKPLAESTIEAETMVAQAEKAGVTISVNNGRRLFPSYLKVKELLSQGAIGSLLSIKFFEGREFAWPTISGFYFNSKTSRKGVLLDMGAHVLDAVCWWLGARPKLVSCKSDSYGGSEAVASVQFEHGNCSGEIKLSWLSRLQNRYIIDGELATIQGEVDGMRELTLVSKSGKRETIKLKSRERNYSDIGNKIVANFIGILINGDKPLIPGNDVMDSIGLIEECYSSMSRFSMPWNETWEAFNGKS